MSRWIAMIAVLAAGCGGWEETLHENRCMRNSDCASGTCAVDLEMCVAAPSDAMEIALQIVAEDPLSNGIVTVPAEPFFLDGPMWHDVELDVGVPVTTSITYLDQHIAASATFELQSEIPGAAATEIEAQTLAQVMTAQGGERFNLATQLLPDRRYEVTVRPNGVWWSELPPYRVEYQTPGGGSAHVTIRYPDPCTDRPNTRVCLQTIEGYVVDREGAGQDGMLVQIVAATGGDELSSRFVTGSLAGAAPGYFRVRILAPSTEDWVFKVQASSERAGPSPSFFVDPSTLIADEDGLVSLLMPSLSSVTYVGSIETSTSDPVAGATMTLTSDDVLDPTTGVVATYRVTTISNADGTFRVQVLPGTYKVRIQASSGNPELGILQEEVRIAPGRGSDVVQGQAFELPERLRFGGTVQTVDGLRMINARVRAQTRGSTYGGTLAAVATHARSNETQTDANGLFDLRLDIGLYDVVVEPPEGTNYPWRVRRDVAIGGANVALSSVFELEAPVPLTGDVWFGPSRIPASGGTVRAFAIVRDRTGTRTVLIGETTIDEDGRYTLLLPPSI